MGHFTKNLDKSANVRLSSGFGGPIMAKAKTKELKESCGKCGCDEFSVGKNANEFRYCKQCNNVWGPMSEDDLNLLAAKRDYDKLKELNTALKTENTLLLGRVSKLEADVFS